ncbi:UPF0104 family protein [Candidatus Woesearchaeota archaeon]|nr:MAG: UPF0104 family protein [Candidatus Woesearchaeota archaeon]
MKKPSSAALLKVLVSAGLLGYLAFTIDWNLFWRSLLGADIRYFLLALFVMPVASLFRFYRFMLIVNERVPEKKRITLYDSFKIYSVGYALNLIMPGSTGDIARSYYAYREYGIKEEMLSASILDLVFGLVALFAFGFYYALRFGFEEYAVASALVLVAGLIFIFFPRIVPWKLVERVAGLARINLDTNSLLNGTLISARLKIYGLFISVVSWYFTFIQFYFITRMYNTGITFSFASGMFPLILVSRLLPIAVNGLGTQEAVVTYLFSRAGVSPAKSVLVSLTLTVTFIVIIGLFGIYLIARMKERESPSGRRNKKRKSR